MLFPSENQRHSMRLLDNTMSTETKSLSPVYAHGYTTDYEFDLGTFCVSPEHLVSD